MTDTNRDPVDWLIAQLKKLVNDVWFSHRDKDSPDYNDCESAECAWCGETKELFAKLADALAQGTTTTATGAQVVVGLCPHGVPVCLQCRADAPAQRRPPALMTYMTAKTTPERDAAFLRTYAERLRNGTAQSWEIPNTVASTLEDIADRVATCRVCGAKPGTLCDAGLHG